MENNKICIFETLEETLNEKFQTEDIELELGDNLLLSFRKPWEHKKSVFMNIEDIETANEDNPRELLITKININVVLYDHVSGKENIFFNTEISCIEEINKFVNYLTDLLNSYRENLDDYEFYSSELLG